MINAAPYDIVCFSLNNWEKRKARKQQFMQYLSLREDVGKVMYVEPPVNVWRLLFLPFLDLSDAKKRRRWKRALSLRAEPLSDKLFLLTPLSLLPFGFRVQAIYELNLFFTSLFVQRKVRALGLKKIALWLYHPLDYRLLGWFRHKEVSCFDWAEEWADYFIEYPPGKKRFIRALEEKIIESVDLVFVVSKKLLKKALALNPHSYQLLDGTVPEIFRVEDADTPAALKGIPHPVAGYVGTITERIDTSLLAALSERLRDVSFVFIGDVHAARVDISSLKQKPNVFFLGGKDYGELPLYMARFDVCLLPYRPLPETSPPTKVFDYLATGKPIVSSDLPELEFLGDLVKRAKNIDEFERYVRESLQERSQEQMRRRRRQAEENSWAVRAQEIMALIEEKSGT